MMRDIVESVILFTKIVNSADEWFKYSEPFFDRKLDTKISA